MGLGILSFFYVKHVTYRELVGLSFSGFLAFLGLLAYIFAKILLMKKTRIYQKYSSTKTKSVPLPVIKEIEPASATAKLRSPTAIIAELQLQKDTDDEDVELSPRMQLSASIVFLFGSAAIVWGFIPIVLLIFEIISAPTSAILSALILLTHYFNHLYRLHPSGTKFGGSRTRRFLRVLQIAAQNKAFRMRRVLIFIVCFSFGFSLLFHGSCLVAYNNEAGVRFNGNGDSVTWSSMLTRYFTLDTQCPPGPPCHFFATLPEDGSDGVIINVHTDIKTQDIIIHYEEATNIKLLQGKLGRYSTKPRSFIIDTIESKGQRVVHHAFIGGLTPNTTYYIQVYYNNQVQTAARYRTLPDKNYTGSMTIVQGGDVGTNDVSYQALTQISLINPDVVLIGGDAAYDNGIKHCYYAWDGFFRMFEDLNKRVGRLVPFVMSVGNHDIGLNANSERKIEFSESGPWLYAWSAQSTKPDPMAPDRAVIPDINERRSYSYHLLGKILLMNLDSGYISKYDGDQLEFIKSVSEKYPDHVKMAMYHDPIYSSCVYACSGEEHWVPQFDRFRYMAIFENHMHAFKRTFPITNRQFNPNGTVYLGDGSWGVAPGRCQEDNSTGVLEKFENTVNFFWVINVDDKEIKYTAMTTKGEILDSGYSQKISNYNNYYE